MRSCTVAGRPPFAWTPARLGASAFRRSLAVRRGGLLVGGTRPSARLDRRTDAAMDPSARAPRPKPASVLGDSLRASSRTGAAVGEGDKGICEDSLSVPEYGGSVRRGTLPSKVFHVRGEIRCTFRDFFFFFSSSQTFSDSERIQVVWDFPCVSRRKEDIGGKY